MTAVTKKGRRADLLYLRDRYARWVEALAERVYQDRFRSGELHGFDEAYSALRDEANARMDWEYRVPIERVIDEIAAEHIATAADAHLIIACSPSANLLAEDGTYGSASFDAGQCVAFDLIRIARSRGWYRARPGEEPSNAQLGLARRRAA
ncbi:hypothetical protein A2cp1_2127 [Anaeromyxobacter dehalogenans 2CP-1]|uniref:Uncharacterized protein n=1 Tax=Anaeromyxobacter dehalogenans (strain ATCC BAA-258 / DSM 21875 / 2CP-1) TaxID=455488 RepID=B8J961_ANAD2|nr:hypothetical protein [Anaeromyxobacter dehalogenans]ACL65467.1 hypothetical protein A2cp1_2127 [Anaeromyxobacter dehalogenans 2CP-1]